MKYPQEKTTNKKDTLINEFISYRIIDPNSLQYDIMYSEYLQLENQMTSYDTSNPNCHLEENQNHVLDGEKKEEKLKRKNPIRVFDRLRGNWGDVCKQSY